MGIMDQSWKNGSQLKRKGLHLAKCVTLEKLSHNWKFQSRKNTPNLKKWDTLRKGGHTWRIEMNQTFINGLLLRKMGHFEKWATLVRPPCCDMLGVVGSSLKMVQFEPTTPKATQHVMFLAISKTFCPRL